jgi:hypothetical protein
VQTGVLGLEALLEVVQALSHLGQLSGELGHFLCAGEMATGTARGLLEKLDMTTQPEWVRK